MNRIAEFVDSFIPKNIPKKKALILKAELTCHILDKADFYREIGYDADESVNKAIDDFGTDKEVSNSISNAFEELYSEKSVFGILAFVIIGVMNFLCFPLDIWVISADFNRNPDPVGAFISFCMIFAVLLMISVARVKKYRKTLVSIGIINTLIAVVLLFSLYPQMASYTVGENIIYIIDRFTPISMGDTIVMGVDGFFIMALWWGILLVPAVYCFIEAVRIKKGKAKTVTHAKKKIAVFSAVFLGYAIISCLMYPTSHKYIRDYPEWFDDNYNYISEESEMRFNEIAIGDSYNEVSNHLAFEGYIPIESYRNSLDKPTKKQFDNNLKDFDFADGYEVWFNPNKNIKGNGFIGITNGNGIVTGKGIGNLNEDMYSYSGKYHNFGYTDISIFDGDDMVTMTNYFYSLETGDGEEEIMSKIGKDFGVVYSKRIYIENNTEKSYYRIYCYGLVNPQAKLDLERNGSRYVELLFENKKLVKGTMYSKIFLDEGTTVTIESVK